MSSNYNQYRAMLAITRASLKAMFKSPSAVGFSLGFPLIFILVFGFIGGGGPSVSFALVNNTDTTNPVIRNLLKNPLVQLEKEKDTTALRQDLEKGRIAATVAVDTVRSPAGFTQYIVHTRTSSASQDKFRILRSALAQVQAAAVENGMPQQYQPVIVTELPPVPARNYTMIDFILPGMLGFSLLSAAVFGTAFLFFNLRQQLVLKRFFATPISKAHIIFGECLARVLFQLLAAVVIIVVGRFGFHFTLVHGWITFFELLVVSLFGLIVCMGAGFVVSNVAKTESVIPFFANILTLPQMLLSGTFFRIDVFPDWLQKFCRILPLTQLNEALRNISFEGAHITDCWGQLGILTIWGIVIYAIAVKLFKWE
ncbi:MAG: ABC transporter permease [Bacteroidetes bacterium]|nr:ABC transporter permease [Bacteroidota bacterium]